MSTLLLANSSRPQIKIPGSEKGLAASEVSQSLADFNPNFQTTHTGKQKGGPRRKSTTPNEISVESVLLLFHESCEGITKLLTSITGLENLNRQLLEFYVTII